MREICSARYPSRNRLTPVPPAFGTHSCENQASCHCLTLEDRILRSGFVATTMPDVDPAMTVGCQGLGRATMEVVLGSLAMAVEEKKRRMER